MVQMQNYGYFLNWENVKINSVTSLAMTKTTAIVANKSYHTTHKAIVPQPFYRDFDILSFLDKVSNEASLFCLQTERRTSRWIFLHSRAIRKIHLAAVCPHTISKRKAMRPDETIKQQNRGARCAFSYLPFLRLREQIRSE